MFSNSHLLEDEVISNAEGEAVLTRSTAIKADEVVLTPVVQEKPATTPTSTQPVVQEKPATTPTSTQPVVQEMPAKVSPTTTPLVEEKPFTPPTTVINNYTSDKAIGVPLTREPVIGIGSPIIDATTGGLEGSVGGGGMFGGGGGGGGRSSEEEGEEVVEEKKGSNWWIWVALGGTAITAWLVFRKKK